LRRLAGDFSRLLCHTQASRPFISSWLRTLRIDVQSVHSSKDKRERIESTRLDWTVLLCSRALTSSPMQPLGEPPPGTDLSANRHALIAALLASSWALAVIVTVLRVICRRLTRNRLWLDDWLILISLVITASLVLNGQFFVRHEADGKSRSGRQCTCSCTLSGVSIHESVLAHK